LQVAQILPEPACHNKIARRDGSTFAAGNLEFQNLGYSTQANQNPQHQIHPRPCDHSAQHSRALVRHVERLGGPARDLCRACWRQICATEVREVLVARWTGLFRRFRPLVACGPGGAVGLLVIVASDHPRSPTATSALIGAEGGAAI